MTQNMLSATPARMELDWEVDGNEFKTIGYLADIKIENAYPDDYDPLSTWWGPQTITIQAKFAPVDGAAYKIMTGQQKIRWSKHYSE